VRAPPSLEEGLQPTSVLGWFPQDPNPPRSFLFCDEFPITSHEVIKCVSTDRRRVSEAFLENV
jgi:hypothetical protein